MRYILVLGFIAAVSMARGNGITVLSNNLSVSGGSIEWFSGGESDSTFSKTGHFFMSDSETTTPYPYAYAYTELTPFSVEISGSEPEYGTEISSAPGLPDEYVSAGLGMTATSETIFKVTGTRLSFDLLQTGFAIYSQDYSGFVTLTDLTTAQQLIDVEQNAFYFPMTFDTNETFKVDPTHTYSLLFSEAMGDADDSDTFVSSVVTLNSAPDHSATLGMLAFSCLGLVLLRRRQFDTISK